MRLNRRDGTNLSYTPALDPYPSVLVITAFAYIEQPSSFH
jgi:hypothetical protein